MPDAIRKSVHALGFHLPDWVRELASALRLKFRRALAVGAAGAVVAVGILLLGGWILNAPMDPCALIALVLFGDAGAWAWVAGFVIQIAVGAAVAVVYAAVFEWFAQRAGALAGLVVAVPHVIGAGLAVGLVPPVYQDPAGPAVPGAFMAYGGVWAVVVFCAAHLAFGAIVGAAYGGVLHPILPADAVRWREAPRP